MSEIQQRLLDFLLPRVCCGCHEPGAFLCTRCLQGIAMPTDFFCPRCLQPSHLGYPCVRCAGRSSLNRLLVAGAYRDVALRRAVETFKYHGVGSLATPLAACLERYLENVQNTAGDALKFDAIVPVPLHRRRYLWRGYNQAQLLAQQLSRHYGWPLREGELMRRRYTRPQVELPGARRANNMRSAFAVTAQFSGDILLVDDVVTTGSTLQECARELKLAGARSVTALALAHG